MTSSVISKPLCEAPPRLPENRDGVYSCGTSLFLEVHWPPDHMDEGSRGSMQGFVRLEGTTENSLPGVCFVLQLHFISEEGAYIGWRPGWGNT